MTFNTELAERVLTRIKDKPETWDQSAWAITSDVCGTAYCFAGHALAELGYKMICDASAPDGQLYASDAVAPNGRQVSIEEMARKKLGLTWDQASQLFNGDNSLDDLEKMVKHYANTQDGSTMSWDEDDDE